ncbi:sucrase ferredoxin [Desertihabitans brevis]|uniref:Sucrase ferredoxin n=1 Tax=Desertihabitans brevis TaxID=2268447 RepID=A0A367YX29_9ACTN|nr:sucrase ferredoxin [Desertihabitans brevis]
MLGTASPGRSWVLVEHPGRWPVRGFVDLPLALEIRRRVALAAAGAGARILLVRRHGRRDGDEALRWAVVHHEDSGAHRQTWGTWADEDDLLALPDALGAPGHTGHPPVLLVCAHGVHDTCCAVRGRPVAAALAARWPELTWECSHVGGDRFAANLVVAPDGVYYGGLDAGSAVDVVADHLAGRIGPTFLRGYTTLPAPEQVAVVEALRVLGPLGRHELEVLGSEPAEEGWEVRLRRRGIGTLVTVQLATERSRPEQLTCRAAGPSTVASHRATAVHVG